MKKPEPHISEAKKQEVEEIKKLIQEYPIFGIVDMTNLPSHQLQKMRSQLKNTVVIKMSKRRIIKISIEQLKNVKKGIEKVIPEIKGMPAIIFTKENPFKLYKMLAKSKSSAPAKAGQIAPNDLIIPAGPTNFTPGPIIGELGQLGIKTGVEDGKVVIKEDVTLVKGGEIINKKVAELLSKLGIEPMEVGLNLLLTFENGLIFSKDVLSIDEQAYINNIKRISTEALNLAIHINYATKETIKLLIKKAVSNARNIAETQDILTSERAQKKVMEAHTKATTLKNKLKLPEPKKEEKPKGEEKKEEKPKKEETPKEEKETPERKEKEEKPTAKKVVEEAEGLTKEEKEKIEREKVEKITKDIISGKKPGG